MLLLKQALDELLMSRDTIIFLLTQLGFVVNLKKSMVMRFQQIEFLGFETKLFLPQAKVEKIVQMSQNAMKGRLTLRDLIKLLRKLTFTIQQFYQQNFRSVSCSRYKYKPWEKNMNYEYVITLDQQAKMELSRLITWKVTMENLC